MEKPFPACDGREPYLFVCYAHADAPEVYGDLVGLKASGFNIWYDEGIAPGSTWRDEVALALSQASLVLYFASPASVRSQNCQQELNFALSRELAVLCVHLAPTELTPGLELALAHRQAILRWDLDSRDYQSKLHASVQRVLTGSRLTAPPVIPPAPAETGRSIAILPLANRSRDPDNEYLSDGITEELIAGLSKLHGLKIKSFLAVAPYKTRPLPPAEIGRELGVEAIVSGSLQQAGVRVRISAALTRVADGQSLWSQHYDNDMSDIFSLQDDVARQIVAALSVELAEARDDPGVPIIDSGTQNVEAYQAYLLGRHTDKNLPRGRSLAIAHLKRAVELDPAWIDAWAELAWVYLWQDLSSTEGGDAAAVQELKNAAIRLQRLDPGKTHKYWFQFDYHLAGDSRAELAFAVIAHQDRYDAGYVRAAYDRLTGRCRDVGLYECGLLMSDAGTEFSYQRACLLGALRRFEPAIEACSAALADDPNQSAARADRCIWAARTGQYALAAADLDVLNGTWGTNHFPAFNYHFWRGELDAARACANWLESRRRYAAIYKALAALMLGDLSRALDHFEVAAQQPGLFTGVMRWGADVYLNDSLREALFAEPRWHAALTTMGVDDNSRDQLIEKLNQLAPHTGITLDRAGTPR